MIRFETYRDQQAIWNVNHSAFQGEAEANLVYALREGGYVEISLVADVEGFSSELAKSLESPFGGAEAVLQSKELATGLQNTEDLPQRPIHLLDATKRERADDTIECGVFERQFFTSEDPVVHFNAGFLSPHLRPRMHSRIRIDSGYLADFLRVVGQIQSGADADLEDFPACLG